LAGGGRAADWVQILMADQSVLVELDGTQHVESWRWRTA
jgi:very-short-patch-repair endonuclease